MGRERDDNCSNCICSYEEKKDPRFVLTCDLDGEKVTPEHWCNHHKRDDE